MPTPSNYLLDTARPATPPGILDLLASGGWARYHWVMSGPGVHNDVSPQEYTDSGKFTLS